MQQLQEVLKATLQNAVTSTDQQLVCTMAMVCRDWRAATQAGPAGLLHATLQLRNSWAPATDGLPSKSMQKLASFSQWLPEHAGLVSGITVSGTVGCLARMRVTRSRETAGFETIAAATFSLALRSAATATAATGATLRPLCLQSYTSNILHSSVVLQALPTANLKQLTIGNADLTQLAVEESGGTMSSVYSRFAVSSRTQLNTLAIGPSIETSEELLQLGALPALQELSLDYSRADVALAAAPAWVQLRQLHSISIGQTVSSPSSCADLCSRLSSLTRLTRLYLNFDLISETEEQAPPLAVCGNLTTLRMLQDLVLGLVDSSGGQVAWVQGDISQLSCLTGLTKLDLYTQNLSQEVFSDATVVQLLHGLKRLQELAVSVKSDTVLPVIGSLKDLKKLHIY